MSTAVVAENNIRTDQLNNKNIEDNIDSWIEEAIKIRKEN